MTTEGAADAALMAGGRVVRHLTEVGVSLGPTIIFALHGDFESRYAELLAFVTYLTGRLELAGECLVNALMLFERAIREGFQLDNRTVRPLLLTSILIATKDFYDEVCTVGDFRKVLPELDLSQLPLMEMELLRLLKYQVLVFDSTQWWLYHDGLAELAGRYRPDLNIFHQRHARRICERVGYDFLLELLASAEQVDERIGSSAAGDSRSPPSAEPPGPPTSQGDGS